MALHTKKEFAAMCGLTTGNLSNYAMRKPAKVIYSGDYVDDSIEPNKSFLAKRIAVKGTVEKIEKKQEGIEQKPIKIPNIQLATIQKPDEPNVKPAKTGSKGTLYEVKTEAEIEKIKVDTRLKVLQEQFKKGQNMPTDAAKVMIAQLGKAYISKFNSAADNLLMEIAKTKDMTRTEMALMRNRLAEIVNEASVSSVEEAKKYMRAVLKEISVQRGVGEHD